jgi:endonuclease YncB( thermonuclease family)
MSERTPLVTDEESDLLDVDGATSPGAEDDDLASLLQRREHARPTRLTWILLTLLILMIGFVGGAFADQRFGTAASSGRDFALPAGMPTAFPFGDAFPGAAGGRAVGTTGGTSAGTGTGAGTTGVVKLVDGQNLYLTDSSGNTVKVRVPSTASVTTAKTVKLAALAAGTTVTVTGATAADGTVTATSVAEGSPPETTDVTASTTGASSAAEPTASALPSPTPSAQGAH